LKVCLLRIGFGAIGIEMPISRLGEILHGMSKKRFRIAFCFAGEKREFVAEVAAILAQRFG